MIWILAGLEVKPEYLEQLLAVDDAAWLTETDGIEEFFGRFGDRLPERLSKQLAEQRARLSK